MFALRRIAVGVDDEILVSVVCCLERCAWLDVDQATGRYLVPFGWVADVHRQRAGQDNECLLLGAVLMATSLRTWFVAPDVRTCVREPRSIAQFCHVPRRFPRLVWPGDPVERRWLNDAEAHSSHSTARYLPARHKTSLGPVFRNDPRAVSGCTCALG
jgi:hypothetical protein